MRRQMSPWLLRVSIFLMFVVVYLTAPVWPLFLASRGLGEGAIGLVLGSYGLSLVVLRLPLGFLSDLVIGYRSFLMSAGFLSIAMGFPLLTIFSAP